MGRPGSAVTRVIRGSLGTPLRANHDLPELSVVESSPVALGACAIGRLVPAWEVIGHRNVQAPMVIAVGNVTLGAPGRDELGIEMVQGLGVSGLNGLSDVHDLVTWLASAESVPSISKEACDGDTTTAPTHDDRHPPARLAAKLGTRVRVVGRIPRKVRLVSDSQTVPFSEWPTRKDVPRSEIVWRVVNPNPYNAS